MLSCLWSSGPVSRAPDCDEAGGPRLRFPTRPNKQERDQEDPLPGDSFLWKGSHAGLGLDTKGVHKLGRFLDRIYAKCMRAVPRQEQKHLVASSLAPDSF